MFKVFTCRVNNFMKIERFKDIEAWKEARNIVNSVYSADGLKRDYSLTDQVKRAAISIMANIAEGFSRKGNKEFMQFLFIAKASAAELQSHFYVALDQGYVKREQFDTLYEDIDRVQRKISNFIKYLNSTL
jgi:four helix bundle protein